MAVCLTLAILGCIGRPQNPAATQPVTVTDPATTQPDYWLDRPATITISGTDFQKLWSACQEATRLSGTDFQKLWSACQEATRHFGFKIDRKDIRHGLLTSEPLPSSQFYEVWRRDVRTIESAAQASIATHRRTLYFEFQRLSDGRYEVTPKVLVERQVVGDRRVTSVTLYRGAVGGAVPARDVPRGTKEADEGILIPARYWYPVGRDPALEKALAKTIREWLSQHSSG